MSELPKMCPKCGHRCIAPTKVLGDDSCDHCKAMLKVREDLIDILHILTRVFTVGLKRE